MPENHAILDAWERVLRERSDAPAVLTQDGACVRTFATIEAESRQLWELLAGLEPGTVAALRAPNSAGWFAMLLALFRARLIPMPLPLSGGCAAIEALAGAVVRFETGPDGSWTRKALKHPPRPWPWKTRPEFLKVTSGTTTAPKAIAFTAAQLSADCNQVCSTMGIVTGDLNYAAIPFSHSYGFSNLVTPLLCRGVPVVLANDLFPRALARGMERARATVFPAVPALLQAIAAVGARLPEPMRLVISAGAPLAPETAERFRAVCGRRAHSFYGASECGGIAFDRGGISADGFVGTPLDGVEVRWEDGTESDGMDGKRIAIRSAAVGTGYFPRADDDALRDGVFRPSDLLVAEKRGMRLVGRESDFINCAGRKVNPASIEAVIRSFSGVAEAVVLGVAGRGGNETIAALVRGNAAIDTGALRRWCANRLPAWQTPREIRTVERIPVNERGKINRRNLARVFFPKAPNGAATDDTPAEKSPKV